MNPQDTALSMVRQYGTDEAAELAFGYASGMYFEQTPHGKAFWTEVRDCIGALPYARKPTPRSRS